MSQLSKIRSSAAVQAAFDEFVQLGCTTFLERYGFGTSRNFHVRDPKTGTDCNSKAVTGAGLVDTCILGRLRLYGGVSEQMCFALARPATEESRQALQVLTALQYTCIRRALAGAWS